MLPELAAVLGDLAPDLPAKPTASATGCTPPSRSCSPPSTTCASAARARGRPLGRSADPPAPNAPSRVTRRVARYCSSYPSATRSGLSAELADRSSIWVARTRRARVRSRRPLLRQRRAGSAAGGDLGPEPPAGRHDADLTQGNAFLVTELWRRLGETGGAAGPADGAPGHVAVDTVGTPQSVRARALPHCRG